MKKSVYPDKSHSSSMVSGTEMSPRPRPDKLSRSPLPAGDHQASTGDQRIPSQPSAGPAPNVKKAATQGFADAKRARGHAYPESKVDTSNHEKMRSETDGTKYMKAHGSKRTIANTSSFGGRRYEA